MSDSSIEDYKAHIYNAYAHCKQRKNCKDS